MKKQKARATRLSMLLVLITSAATAQSKIDSSNEQKGSIMIVYDVIYETRPTREMKKKRFYTEESMVVFNQDWLIEKTKYKNEEDTERFTLFNFSEKKKYSCNHNFKNGKKIAYYEDFPEVKKSFEVVPGETKEIAGHTCQKYLIKSGERILISYNTLDFDIDYPDWFGLPGIALEREEYRRGFGITRSVAGEVTKESLPDDYYSLKDYDIQEVVYTLIEKPATFKGGKDAMEEYIRQNLVYPQEAKKNEVNGRVFVQFIVEKDGTLSNIEVVKGIGHGADEEAIRVFKSMPNWEEGRQRGNPVRQRLITPITFKF